MRRALFVLTLFGCSSRYYVRPQHYEAAQQARMTTGQDVSIAALDSDRAPTYLRVARVGRTVGLDPYGLLEVRASDSRPGLSITGWCVAGMGGVLGITGASLMAVEETQDVATILFLQSGIFIAAGVALLLIGYSGDGPETDAPTPGMPPRVALPSRLALSF